MKPREGMFVDPAQTPAELMEPSMQAGQAPSMRQSVTFDVSLDDCVRVVKFRPVDEADDAW